MKKFCDCSRPSVPPLKDYNVPIYCGLCGRPVSLAKKRELAH